MRGIWEWKRKKLQSRAYIRFIEIAQRELMLMYIYTAVFPYLVHKDERSLMCVVDFLVRWIGDATLFYLVPSQLEIAVPQFV